MFEQDTNATLTCNSDGGPDNNIIWEVDGDPLPVFDSHQISVFVNISSGGNYTCIVTNSAGRETGSTMLYVHPLITVNPEFFSDVTNGTSTAFMCDAESFPEAMYQWIRLDGLMVRDDSIDQSTTNILSFDPALFGDEGIYICMAFINITNKVYSVNSTEALLTRKLASSMILLLFTLIHQTVSPEGTVQSSPDIINGFPGGNASFNCSSNGGPGNNFQWLRLRDGIIVGNESWLTLTDLDAFDGGQYQCFVENRAGNDTTTVTLNSKNSNTVRHCLTYDVSHLASNI